ncbi:MAG: hypothetical protein LBM99_06530, partial [Bacillales bacterium]|nr:hypothetical protein [Bacillales bacterium]
VAFLLGSYLLVYVIVKLILQSKKKDYTIFRSLGLDAKTIKLFSYIEIVSLILFSSLIVLSVIAVCSSLKIGVIYSFFYYVGSEHYFLIVLLSVLLGLLLAYRFNKYLIKKSIISTMKDA